MIIKRVEDLEDSSTDYPEHMDEFCSDGMCGGNEDKCFNSYGERKHLYPMKCVVCKNRGFKRPRKARVAVRVFADATERLIHGSSWFTCEKHIEDAVTSLRKEPVCELFDEE